MRESVSGISRRVVIRLLAGGSAVGLTSALTAGDEHLLAFDSLYKSFGVLGFQFSDQLVALSGVRVRIEGYMAPPLKAESRFFVLTRQPLAICPFCQSDADWPTDIIVVFLRGLTPLVSGGRKVVVSGRLEIGSAQDAETGFVSQIRIVDADFRAL